MGTRAIKKQVRKILAQPDLDKLLDDLHQFPEKELINALFFSLYGTDELISRHAVSAMGEAIARLAHQEMEEARIIMRRLLWSLNDESGGIGWGAPESMAEAMYHHDGLAREYIHMLVSYTREDGEEEWQDGNYLEHEALQRGLLWGIGRLARKRRAGLIENGILDSLPPYAESTDAVIRGLTAWALGRLGAAETAATIKNLADDPATLRLYHHGAIVTTSVGELARRALDQLQ